MLSFRRVKSSLYLPRCTKQFKRAHLSVAYSVYYESIFSYRFSDSQVLLPGMHSLTHADTLTHTHARIGDTLYARKFPHLKQFISFWAASIYDGLRAGTHTQTHTHKTKSAPPYHYHHHMWQRVPRRGGRGARRHSGVRVYV